MEINDIDVDDNEKEINTISIYFFPLHVGSYSEAKTVSLGIRDIISLNGNPNYTWTGK